MGCCTFKQQSQGFVIMAVKQHSQRESWLVAFLPSLVNLMAENLASSLKEFAGGEASCIVPLLKLLLPSVDSKWGRHRCQLAHVPCSTRSCRPWIRKTFETQESPVRSTALLLPTCLPPVRLTWTERGSNREQGGSYIVHKVRSRENMILPTATPAWSKMAMNENEMR